MSATEIIREIQLLPPAAQREVEAFFRHDRRRVDPVWQAELARRLDEARAGRSLSSTEVRMLVEQAAR